MFLIDDILFFPIKSIIWLGKKLNDMAERELTDEGLIKEKLMELQLQFELDEIDEKEYNEQEKILLEKLNAIRSSRDEESTG
jgi:hypothetical protein